MDDVTTETGLTDDAFELAFEAAAGDTPDTAAESVNNDLEGKDKQDDVELPPEKAEGADTGADAAEAEEETDDAAAAKVVEEAKAKETAEAAAKTPAPKPKVDPAVEAKATAEAKAKRDAEEAEAKRQADEAKAKEAYTEDEIAAVNETAANFPEVAKALKAVERVAFTRAENAFNAKLAEISAQFSQRLAPLASVVQRTAKNEHEATILKAHPDAFTALPQVEAWIGKQPAILQTAYNHVLDAGSTQDIIELFTVYKDATKAPAAPAVPDAEIEATKQKEAEKQKRLEAQEGVRGRNTSGRATVDPDDFEGAFDKFAAA